MAGQRRRIQPGSFGVPFYHQRHRMIAEPLWENVSMPIHRPEHPAGLDSRSRQPRLQRAYRACRFVRAVRDGYFCSAPS